MFELNLKINYPFDFMKNTKYSLSYEFWNDWPKVHNVQH